LTSFSSKVTSSANDSDFRLDQPGVRFDGCTIRPVRGRADADSRDLLGDVVAHAGSVSGGTAEPALAGRTWRKPFVLRGYAREPIESVEYELEVLRRLGQQGWPVPEPVQEPAELLGRLWCLFTLLPGVSRPEQTSDERRARGRLLARLHEATASLADMGQRRGFRTANEVVCDPQLLEAIRRYERVRPAAGHAMRWHLDKAGEIFDGLKLNGVEAIVLHGDLTPWNMLFEGERVSGIVDFEAMHLNYRVSDFALSWRGHQDDVVQGYEQVRALNELDWQLLVPCYWSWLFLGIQEEISSMIQANAPYHDFAWQVRHLIGRSKISRVAEYPGA
jgi:aminoglycoside phosphotransferase (APT) family kinase protein